MIIGGIDCLPEVIYLNYLLLYGFRPLALLFLTEKSDPAFLIIHIGAP
jgi:hypothetical protein